MMVLATSPPQSPLNPRALAEEVKVEPLALFMYDTMVSGGCDTTAQTTEKKLFVWIHFQEMAFVNLDI